MLKYLLQITQVARLNLAESNVAAYFYFTTPTILLAPGTCMTGRTWKGTCWCCRVFTAGSQTEPADCISQVLLRNKGSPNNKHV